LGQSLAMCPCLPQLKHVIFERSPAGVFFFVPPWARVTALSLPAFVNATLSAAPMRSGHNGRPVVRSLEVLIFHLLEQRP
jgi:hypothetical protein